jgi:hypothetical protein
VMEERGTTYTHPSGRSERDGGEGNDAPIRALVRVAVFSGMPWTSAGNFVGGLQRVDAVWVVLAG